MEVKFEDNQLEKLDYENSIKSIFQSIPANIAIVDIRNNYEIIYANNLLLNFLDLKQNMQERSLNLSDIFDQVQFAKIQNQILDFEINEFASEHFGIYKLSKSLNENFYFRLYINRVGGLGFKSQFILLFVPEQAIAVSSFTSSFTSELALESVSKSGFGTFEIDARNKNVILSEGFCHLLDISFNDVTVSEALARKILFPDDFDKFLACINKFLEDFKPVNINLRIVTGKNDIKFIECHLKSVDFLNEKNIKYIGYIKDITERVSIEQILEKKIEQLNLSNKELEEFAFIASHDIQEPLRKITTFITRLSLKYKHLLADEGAMYIDRITSSAENMRILINDLLEFSRISKTQLPFSSVDLNSILKQVKNDLEIIIEENGVKIESEELPVIEAIPSQMKQLIFNIINNAIKFKKAILNPVVKISVIQAGKQDIKQYNLNSEKKYYKIQIEDNGIGFEPEYAQKIFQVFLRLHGKSEFPGSGIGLAICKKIVERHQGLIFANSIPGKGSVFTFIIPDKQGH